MILIDHQSVWSLETLLSDFRSFTGRIRKRLSKRKRTKDLSGYEWSWNDLYLNCNFKPSQAERWIALKTAILFWSPEKGLGDFELESNFQLLIQSGRVQRTPDVEMSLMRKKPKVYNWISKIKGIQLDEIFGNARLSGSRQRKTKLQMDVSKSTIDTTPTTTPSTTLGNLPLIINNCITPQAWNDSLEDFWNRLMSFSPECPWL